MNLSDELVWRGLFKQTTYKDVKILDGGPVTFYWGVDPSADSMTIGNLAAAMLVKHLIKHGHKAVLLIGGATGLIGDPDGKTEERNLLSPDQIESNKKAIVTQYKNLFGEHDFELVDNIDWFKDFGYLDFLRGVGKHVPMRQMLGRDFVSTRLSEEGHGISYAEFSYVLIQAYDFLHLYKNNNVSLQVCGSDQWGNSIAGVELIRRTENGEAHVYSLPLTTDQTTGRKFGKSEVGAVWLDPNKTTPTQFYQFWINTADDNVEKFLKIYTELPREEIENIMSKQKEDPSKRSGQLVLAEQVTKLVHGEGPFDTAKKVTAILTAKEALDENTGENVLANLRQEIANVKISMGAEIAEALVSSGLASSKTEARQLLSANAVSINGVKTSKDHFEADDFKNNLLLLRRGKAFKDSALVELTN
jgi:tyrosyl-tRNA synthetase